MSEAEMLQAYYNAVSLAYTASQWWLTVSTALVVATYFAAKHIPHWLFGIVILLYVLTAVSCIYEVNGYSYMAELYLQRLAVIWNTDHVVFPNVGGPVATFANNYANLGIFVLGSISAAMFSFVTWRGARMTG